VKNIFHPFFTALILFTQFSFCHATINSQLLSEIETSLKKDQPETTLKNYVNCEKEKGTACEGIASGSPEWISMAERLINYSDAGLTEDILSSLGEAMQKSPRNVLPLVNKTPLFTEGWICTPFISNEIPIKARLAILNKSKKAIESVQDRHLQKQKTTCLNQIKHANNLIMNDFFKSKKFGFDYAKDYVFFSCITQPYKGLPLEKEAQLTLAKIDQSAILSFESTQALSKLMEKIPGPQVSTVYENEPIKENLFNCWSFSNNPETIKSIRTIVAKNKK
jgi:hypothetical protein